jgi:uncharacterized protein YkwD
MKRYLILLLAVGLTLTGCASAQAKDPFKVDTVVMIPVDPTEVPTEEPTEAPTGAPTESPTEAPTAPKETAPKKTSSGGSSGKGSSGKTQRPKETEPPFTDPPVVENPPSMVIPTEPPYDPSSYSIGNLEYAMLDTMNAYRADAAIGELTINKKLSGIAYLRAQEAVDYWSHTRPDGRSYTSALSDYGYSYGSSAELMVYATGNGDAAAMVGKWMDSASHSEKLLSDGFSKVGIGVYRTGGMTYVVCLLVG